jgi:hypothetical protein
MARLEFSAVTGERGDVTVRPEQLEPTRAQRGSPALDRWAGLARTVEQADGRIGPPLRASAMAKLHREP